MKFQRAVLLRSFLLLAFCLFLFSFLQQPRPVTAVTGYRFPYLAAGMTERQAAAHLLSRFSFGATPGQVDEVVKQGLENWFAQQLSGKIPDDSLNARLVDYDALKLSNAEINEAFPRPVQVLKRAIGDGIIQKDSSTDQERKNYRAALAAYSREKNYRKPSDLIRQFINNKIVRAAYSKNQLREVLTDFWFNHFNVSFTKKDCALFIPAYERDVIRPNVAGKFEDMLIATAKSPAMLLYLDNFMSVGTNEEMSGNEMRIRKKMAKMSLSGNDSASEEMLKKLQKRKKNQGLNENYAREVMELHTLGVDGGYTQNDVTQAAKILTGWTLYPVENAYSNSIKKVIDEIGEDKLAERGFLHEGDFLFAMNRHDKSEKNVLQKKFVNAGYAEGALLLKTLAQHPSTASFICKKLAVHFVSDDPPESLLKKMSKTFLEKDGDIKEVLITMASSKEFWDVGAVRSKIKSPFELVISSVRALDADIRQPYQLFGWMDKMGQKIYYYQAPTGFPDKAQYWINTGALLNRMNFGLAIASNQMRGITTRLLTLNDNHEPESPQEALVTYCKLTMPERDLSATIKRLTPLLTQPALDKKLTAAAAKLPESRPVSAKTDVGSMKDQEPEAGDEKQEAQSRRPASDNMLAQVVGIIIGSPEFQRK